MNRPRFILGLSALWLAAAARPAYAQSDASPPATPPAVVTVAGPPVAPPVFVERQAQVTVVAAPQASRWYGWQILLPDLAGVGLVVGGLGATPDSSAGTALAVTGGLTLTLDGAIVHAAHGRWGVAGASLGVRVGGAILGAVVGGLVASQTSNANPNADVPPGLVGALYGFCAGAVVGMVVDDAVLAWEKVPVAPGAPVSRPPASPFHLALAPLTGPRMQGLGLVGTF